MLMKLCPKCRAIIPQTQQYCDVCKPIIDKAIAERKAQNKAKYDKKYNKFKRNQTHAKFYQSIEWKTLRAVKLSQSNYICEHCKAKGITTLAVDVHHKETLRDAWDKRLDINNLECLCVECHNLEHKRWSKPVIKLEQ